MKEFKQFLENIQTEKLFVWLLLLIITNYNSDLY